LEPPPPRASPAAAFGAPAPPVRGAALPECEDAALAAADASRSMSARHKSTGKRRIAATPVYWSSLAPLTCMLLKI
jgi:hypothetical protein